MSDLYLDIFSGISGDMFLGALLDLGVELHQVELELAKLGLHGYHLHATRRHKSNIQGVKFDVHLEADHHPDDPVHPQHQPAHAGHGDECHHGHAHHHDERSAADPHGHHHGQGHAHDHDHDEPHPEHLPGRNFADIQKMIAASALSPWVKEKSTAVFRRVAVAEGKIHGHPPAAVHFHEVGAVDSIVDIVGACVALEMLGKPRVLAAPVVEGSGWVDCAHGRFPVPTTATLEILGARGIALTQCAEPHELVTPTGAALLAEFVEQFGPMEGLIATRVGYGLGTRELASRPNVLRAVLGTATVTGPAGDHDWETDRIAVLETNLDDLNAEILGHFVERALAAGALDVFHTPIHMKKNRPGVLLTVLCAASDADRFSELILRETSAFGVRRSLIERRKLRREFTRVKLPYGEVTVKLGTLD
ncbi:MAG: nickel pincer cofactor biosynthesis protein LarC, partial [Verrucomicrobia bacterium]|nr:nickel pincer cofactor biosynthesis protein LarC [Verrucomicrobiota bacterium]